MNMIKGFLVTLAGVVSGALLVGVVAGLVTYANVHGQEFGELGAYIYGVIGAMAGGVTGGAIALVWFVRSSRKRSQA